MAGQQRRLAHSSKRDSASMKTLSLLGTVFLPATFLASLFGMNFFDVQSDSGSTEFLVSRLLWVYFAVTLPVTLGVVLFWRYWDRKREAKYELEDIDLEEGIETMEAQIMTNMRKRTMSKKRTWDTGKKQ